MPERLARKREKPPVVGAVAQQQGAEVRSTAGRICPADNDELLPQGRASDEALAGLQVAVRHERELEKEMAGQGCVHAAEPAPPEIRRLWEQAVRVVE